MASEGKGRLCIHGLCDHCSGFSQCWQTEGRFRECALGLCESVSKTTASHQAKSECMSDKGGNGCAERWGAV